MESSWEMAGLQSVGLNRGWTDVNPTAWYISALLISSFFLFFLLRHYERLTIDFIIPLSVMVIYFWFYRSKGNLDFVIEMEGFYLNGALMRAVADMGLGVVAARLNRYLGVHAKKLSVWKCMGALGFLFVIVYSATHGESNRDFVLAIILTISVAIAFLPNETCKIPNVVKKWSSYCLGIYLVHEAFRTYLFPTYVGVPEEIWKRCVIALGYAAAITVTGIVLTLLSELLRKWIRKCGKLVLR